MSPADAAVGVGVSQFELTLDELRLLRDRIPGLVLPSFIQPVPPDDEDAAFASLRAGGLVGDTTVSCEADWTGTIAPAVTYALALQMMGDFVLQIDGWSPNQVTAHSSTVTRGVASGLTAVATTTQPDPLPSTVVALTLAPVANLSKSLADLIPSTEGMSAAPSGKPVTVGLVESRALVAAIRAGDPRVIGAVAAEIHSPGAQEALGPLAGPLTSGFRAKVFTPSGGCVYSGDWFLGTTGWLKISVAASPDPSGSVTAESVTDTGTVTITAVTAESIEIQLLNLVSEGVRNSYAERQA
jgi:hypothetical protein